VFASLNRDAPEITEHLARAKYYIDLFMDLSPEGEVEARCGTHKYGYDGNWKFQMENGVDGYHLILSISRFSKCKEKSSGGK
jgi:benzoate/toluate 1,2-dioxygenase alpha subunit